ERAGGIVRAQRAPDEHMEAELSRQRGEAEVGLGRYREALGSYERARAAYQHLFGSSHLSVGQALLGTGEAMVGLRRFAEAASVLRQASKRLAGADRPWLAARAKFALAQNIWGETANRRRALALASEARADWTSLVPADRAFLRRIDAWMRAVRP